MVEKEAIKFLFLAIAVWRVGSMLSNDREAGPFDILHKIRRWAGVRYDERSLPFGTNEFASMLLCIGCNTLWLGLLAYGAYVLWGDYAFVLSVPFVFNGFAVALERWLDGVQ